MTNRPPEETAFSVEGTGSGFEVADKLSDHLAIEELLAKIEAKRAAMPPDERAKLEAEELIAQRESFIRAMEPCEHGDYDWETCPQCLAGFAEGKDND